MKLLCRVQGVARSECAHQNFIIVVRTGVMVARDVCRRVMHSCSPRSVNKSPVLSSLRLSTRLRLCQSQRAYSVKA